MTKSNTIATYFMNITHRRAKLITIGEKLDDIDLISLALNGIPTSWEPFIQGVCSRDALRSLDRLWVDFVQEEGRIMSRSGSKKSWDEENLALAAQTNKGKGRKFPYKNKGNIHVPTYEHKTQDLSHIKCYNF